jgi:hypothetical protein
MEYILPRSNNYQYDDKQGRVAYPVSNFLNYQYGGSSGGNELVLGQFDHDNRMSHLSVPAGITLSNTPFANIASHSSGGLFSGGRAKKLSSPKNIEIISDEQFDKLFNVIKYNNLGNSTRKRSQGKVRKTKKDTSEDI